MTVAGMVGISSIFTAGLEGGGGTTQLISLLVPQGWAMRGWRHVLDGQGVEAVLPTVVVMLALAVLFFAIGVYRFNKRFA
jgi:ABC-type multidrug transport system permease subunit